MKISFFFMSFVIFLSGYASDVLARPVVGFIVTSSGLGDQSFNDMAFTGLIRVRKDLDIVLIREMTDNTEASRAAAVKRLIKKGAGLIVASGWEFRSIIHDAAGQYPDTRFLLNDVPLQGLDNVVSTVFAQNEGAYLAGALAGWMTKTARVGFVGGEDIPVIRDFQTGFDAGLHHARPEAELLSKFVAPRGSEPSGFNNPRGAYRVAEDLYRSGADILFGVAGLSGNGVIQAARKFDLFVIGVDADQDHMAKGLILTSVMKRLDHTTFTEVKRALTGKFSPGIRYYDLKKGGISLSPMTYSRHLIPAVVQKKLTKIETIIKTGELKVPGEFTFNLNAIGGKIKYEKD